MLDLLTGSVIEGVAHTVSLGALYSCHHMTLPEAEGKSEKPAGTDVMPACIFLLTFCSALLVSKADA